MHARVVVALLLVLAAGCGDDRSRTERLREEALQRLESRPLRSDVSPQELHDANVALAEDVASLADEMGELPTEAEQAAVDERDQAAQARAIAAECTQLGQQVEALQRAMQDPEPSGGEPVDVAALQGEIDEAQSRIERLCH
jgi:chromosome segregation ATPase